MDGVKLTLFCTQGTADTAGLTYGLHILALVMGTALYQVLRLVGNQFNQVVGTGGHALAAGNAFLLVNHCHAVHHMDGVKGTCLYTGAVTHASIGTCLLTCAGHHRYLLAVVHSIVVVLHFCLVTCALTFDKRNLLLSSPAGNAHDGPDFLCCGCAAHRTCAYLCLTGRNGLCQCVTSRVTAAAAVVAGQLIADQDFFFIYFTLNFSLAMPRKIPIRIPRIPTTAAAI